MMREAKRPKAPPMTRLAVLAVALFAASSGSGAQQPAKTAGRTITGVVFDSLVTRRPLAGAEVVIVESGRSAMSDARGVFRFDSIAAGTVRLTFYHGVLDSLGVGAAPMLVTVPDSGDVKVTLTTPSTSTILRAFCQGANQGPGMVVGRVRDVDDRSLLPDAEVTASWSEWRLGKGGVEGTERRIVSRTDSSGAFRLCGVPVDIPIAAHATAGEQTTGVVPLDLSARPLLAHDFSVSRRDTASRVRRDSGGTVVRLADDSIVNVVGSASIAGVVRTADNRRVTNALATLLGSGRSARSDSTGRFRLFGLPAGTQSLDVRALGFAPTSIDVDLPTNGVLDVNVTLNRHAQTLAAVKVVESGTIFDASGFETRRRTYAFGHYITPDEIRRRGVFDTHRLIPDTGAGRLRSTFGVLTLQGGCAPVVFIDGNLVDPGTPYANDAIDMIRPRDVRGMEIYSTADAAPFQFRDPRRRCGSVVIWTRPLPRKTERPK
jgi:hypothetical protein